MKSIQARFEKLQRSGVAAYPILVSAVHEQGFTRKAITKAFRDLIPESDFHPSERRKLIDYLYETSLRRAKNGQKIDVEAPAA